MKNIDEKECRKAFGRFIKERREQLGLYQSEVAEAIGLTQGRISQLETGMYFTDLVGALKICEVLELDLKDFIQMYMESLS